MKYKRVYPADYEITVENMFNNKAVSPGIYEALHDAFIKMHNQYVGEKGRPLNCDVEYNTSFRYEDVFTVKQKEFNYYPAAKVQTGETEEIFDVLAEGPFAGDFNLLLGLLEKNKISVLIPVGKPNEIFNGNSKEKFFDYMADAEKISLESFFQNASSLKQTLPQTLHEQAEKTNFEFYRCTQGNAKFYIMHIPNWDDHGMPRLSQADKIILGYYYEYGYNACFHCSAGIGRSVAVMIAKMFYQNVYKKYDEITIEKLKEYFIEALKIIKDVKPAAGEKYQLLTVPGIAEDAYELVGHELKYTKTCDITEKTIESSFHVSFRDKGEKKRKTDEPNENNDFEKDNIKKPCLLSNKF